MEEWYEGTLILGRGINYFCKYYLGYYKGGMIAWGHLGHVTTLAQLGLIGLFVYSFYFPLKVVQMSIKLWDKTSHEAKFFGLLSGLTMIWCWICFFMSDSFLGQHVTEGIIFGSAWRQEMLLKDDKV